jgi:hypothetical protein
MGNPNKTGELWMLVFHEALYVGQQFKESLICPLQMRAAAGVTIEDAPIRFDTSSSRSVQGTLEILLDMLGVISHLRWTRLPTSKDINYTVKSEFQSGQLTEDRRMWEPYHSREIAQREDVAREAHSTISAIQVVRVRSLYLGGSMHPRRRKCKMRVRVMRRRKTMEGGRMYPMMTILSPLVPRRP